MTQGAETQTTETRTAAPPNAEPQDTEAQDSLAGCKEAVVDAVRRCHRAMEPPQEFRPGVTEIWSSGAVLDEADRVALVEAALELRIAAGRNCRRFESALARRLKLRKAHMTNSGSSANLLAVSALTSPALEDRRLRPGDEVITVATGFPTTVNPILQNGLLPVFVDTDPTTYNTTADRVARAIGPRTRAIVLAHALGNPFPAEEIAQLADEHGLFLVEDNCDALGATYGGRLTGTFGELTTVSFYPAHHLTTGEGGCVLTSNLALSRVVESLRDWGRDCWCEPGESDTCRKRFAYQMGTLPAGYDHKYIFSHVGYNLKATDLQGALGLSQLAKLDGFIQARRRNWRRLREALDGTPWLRLPEATPGSEPSWFGFVLTVDPGAPFGRAELVDFLEARKIGTRRLFAGNLTRHPAYLDRPHRVAGELVNSDIITDQTFWVGVYPGLTDEMLDYVAASVKEFVRRRGGGAAVSSPGVSYTTVAAPGVPSRPVAPPGASSPEVTPSGYSRSRGASSSAPTASPGTAEPDGTARRPDGPSGAGATAVGGLADLRAWIEERRAGQVFSTERVPFTGLDRWSWTAEGNLVHDSGRFFSVEGMHVTEKGPPYGEGRPAEWHQPVLHQPEAGVLGLLLRYADGVPQVLMQAKAEPGNPNTVQLSPTVQATRSNYTRAHRGGSVPYLDYFTGAGRGRVVAHVLQSECGSWFWRKANRNMIVEVDGEVPLLDDFRWLSLDDISALLHEDLLVNMDARTVLACLPRGQDGTGEATGTSGGEPGALMSWTELLSWFTEQRARHHVLAERVRLGGLPGWRRGADAIEHEEGRYFRIVAVRMKADRREVAEWTQPLLQPVGQGVVAFLVHEFRGVPHVLVHARVEGGFLGAVELGPTVQCVPENHAHLPQDARPAFLDSVLRAGPDRVRYACLHSEEGGRFLDATSRYMIVSAEPDTVRRDLPPGYAWVTPGQLRALVRHGHYLNVQARSLLACLSAVEARPAPRARAT